MASTPVEFAAPSGLTLTAKLFPLGSDSIANGASGDSATENTNNKGVYSFTVTEALSGYHRLLIQDGSSNTIALLAVYLEDTTTRRYAQELSDAALAIIDNKTLQQALRYIAATTAGKSSGAGSGTEVFTGLDGSTARVTGTISSGNRTAISYD